ncbi:MULTISPECIES: glycerophosphodiester phosphodiesterase family protein [unclassified Crossiella]|uniref:glycerophosphodiester phosphodiesterase family protein n=1 Tax=unclassified Crossiella TaxID=2620835 RepID=UPI002000015A|nr:MULTISPECIES: glycerophosphodiester phosphodiesterase family protein [unclassified Crossiella]MCK2244330.1 glycerophosphodiester phosphodiesterase [Crossiella sp. S99.2]MCK2257842.1 glycerophosphodiester phosphodiesterase [Crossiella sp. S99.1]
MLPHLPTPAHPYLDGPYPRAFAHRGWHLDELAGMENSLSGFRRAVKEGFSYLETDVHATSDGVVVVHHDDLLDRTTDGVGAVADQLWASVKQAKVGGVEPIARLEDLLEELPEAYLNVDVKSDSAVAPVLRLLQRLGAWDRVALASFSERRLARLRRLAGPRLMTALGPRSAGLLWAGGRIRPLAAKALVKGSLAQVPATAGKLTVVDQRFVAAAHRLGIEVHVWTIDTTEEMTALLEVGVDGLVTDRPDLLREVLRSRSQWPAG